MKRSFSLFIIISLLSGGVPVFGDYNQKTIFEGSQVYEALESIYLEAGLSVPSSARPFTVSEIRSCLDRISYGKLSAAGRKTYDYIVGAVRKGVLYNEGPEMQFNTALKSNLEGYFHSNSGYDSFEYGYEERMALLDIPLEIWLFNSMYAVMEPVFKKDPFVAQNQEVKSNFITDFSDVDFSFPFTGYLSIGRNHWNFQYGRDLLSWGNGKRGNMMISDYADYHDLIKFTTFWKAFKYTTTYIAFDSWSGDDIKTMSDFSNAFIGHRIEARFFDRVGIAISESLMLEDKYFEPRYLNPFMVYHNWFLNDRYGNINMELEAEFNPYRWLNIYGQLCADQIQSSYEKNTYPGADAMPDAYGYILGGNGSYPLGKGYLNGYIEWAKTDPWFYLMTGQPDYIVERRVTSNYLKSMIILKKPLGYWMGPDSEVFSAGTGYSVYGLFSVSADIQIRQKGEIDIDTPFQSGPEAVALTSPSGDYPEKTTVFSIGGEYNPFRFLTFGSQFYFIGIENRGHNPGETARDVQWVPYLSITLSK